MLHTIRASLERLDEMKSCDLLEKYEGGANWENSRWADFRWEIERFFVG